MLTSFIIVMDMFEEYSIIINGRYSIVEKEGGEEF
jgi:hypothetical protein